MILARHHQHISQRQLTVLLLEQGVKVQEKQILLMERGKRVIRLYEAVEITAILGLDLTTLQRKVPGVDQLAETLAATARAWAAGEQRRLTGSPLPGGAS